MSRFKDHFSGHASEYASFRPKYPDAVADYLARLVVRRHLAWEAGCGSGQFTPLLALHFEHVLAVDASAEQLSNAPPLPNVTYRCAPAEDSGLEAGSVDLVAAAQAAHWFDLSAYYDEVRRVGHPGTVVALMTYSLMRIDERIDSVVGHFYDAKLSPYWPAERQLVEDRYRSIPFPFEEIDAPQFELSAEWTLAQVVGYVETWSGVRALVRREGRRPVDELEHNFAEVWGEASQLRSVRWPLAVRLGRIR